MSLSAGSLRPRECITRECAGKEKMSKQSKTVTDEAIGRAARMLADGATRGAVTWALKSEFGMKLWNAQRTVGAARQRLSVALDEYNGAHGIAEPPDDDDDDLPEIPSPMGGAE
jgi:hypothetical protein